MFARLILRWSQFFGVIMVSAGVRGREPAGNGVVDAEAAKGGFGGGFRASVGEGGGVETEGEVVVCEFGIVADVVRAGAEGVFHAEIVSG